MSDDPLISAALLRGRQLLASRKQAEADLARHVANDDEAMAADSLGDLAALDEQGAALNRLYDQHVQANTPRQREPETGAEWLGKPIHKMGGDDALRTINYGKQPGDPTIVTPQEYNEQVAKLRRLKAQGQYRD